MSDSEHPARDYRAATEALDERPSEATRAAILAAAARQVHATPREATDPLAGRRPMRSRWPLGAAAAVLLSTLAVMMAVRTEQEMPTFIPSTKQIETSAAKADTAPPAAERVKATEEIARPEGNQLKPAKRAQSIADAGNAPAESRPAAAKPAQPARDAAPRTASNEAKVARPFAEPLAKQEAGALQAPAAPPAPPAAASEENRRSADAREDAAKPKGAAAGVSDGERQRGEAVDGMSAGVLPSQAAGAAMATAKTHKEADVAGTVEMRADDWIEKIIKLRNAGRHDEANAELKRFRERYPQVQIPAGALPPTGTR